MQMSPVSPSFIDTQSVDNILNVRTFASLLISLFFAQYSWVPPYLILWMIHSILQKGQATIFNIGSAEFGFKKFTCSSEGLISLWIFNLYLNDIVHF